MNFLHNGIVVSCGLMFCFSVRAEAGIISCINGIDSNYRIRYTMEEANSATSDDTENMIEWIFE